MKTPLDTAEIAGLVQSFLLEKNIKVARCDALELAAKIKGSRDLHQDQAEESIAPRSTLSNGDACLFFSMIGTMAGSGLTLVSALKNTAELLPSDAQWLPAFLAKRMEDSDADFADLLKDVGFPAFVTAIAGDGYRRGDPERGCADIVRMLEKAEKRLPTLTLNAPAFPA